MNIESVLEAALVKDDRPLEPHETFWASSLGYCLRKQVAQRAGLPPTVPLDFRLRLKFLMGSAIHTAVQKKLLTSGYLNPTWTRLEGEHIVEERWTYRSYSGRPDGVRLVDPAILEIKSTDDSSIVKYDTPPEGYLWQGFLNCLGTNIPQLVLFQIGRKQGLTKNREYPLTEEWTSKINEEIALADAAWESYQATKELPKCRHRYEFENKTCSYQEV